MAGGGQIRVFRCRTLSLLCSFCFFFQAEDGIRDSSVTGVQTCALPISQERLPLGFRTDELPPDITPFALARDEVAFVGEAVAVVIAQTRYRAEDAAALVGVDYDPLPAVSEFPAALPPGSPRGPCARAGNPL